MKMKKVLCLFLTVFMVLSLIGCGNAAPATPETETTIKVAAIETAYGAEMWQQVADAFTAQTGIKVELITDKNLEDVIGPPCRAANIPM